MASDRQPAALETFDPKPEKSEIESPSLSTPQARARFEFESGKSNEGTKILMVEWEDDERTRDIKGQWTISWEGKSTVLPAKDGDEAKAASAHNHRMFFLLPPGVSIPTTVTLTLNPADRSSGAAAVEWRTNPLPAIFPPGFAKDAVGGGRASKGVLHTLWAKKRLSTLLSEIESEEKLFPEGIGLDMAVKEKEWIEESFGLGPMSSAPSLHRQALKGLSSDVPQSPSSPLSPGGSRLSEKLKGLKLQTTATDNKPRDASERNPLSPEDADIAVPSFSAFKGPTPNVLAAKPAQKPASNLQPFVPQISSRTSDAGMGSIADMMAGGAHPGFKPSATAQTGANDDEEESLFALPLSPRSPEMTKSPFTFAERDIGGYIKS